MFNGRLYTPVHVNIYGALRSDKIESSPDFIKNKLSHSVHDVFLEDNRKDFDETKSVINTEARSLAIDKLNEEFKYNSDSYLMFNDQVWVECGEPYYNLKYFGIYNEPGAFINFRPDYYTLDDFNENKVNTNSYSAFHFEEFNRKYLTSWNKAAWKERPRDTEFPVGVKERIEVLIPEAVQFKDFIDLAELKKQNMTIDEILQESKLEEAEPIAKTPEDACNVFVKLTKDVLSLQPVKNIKFATKMVLSSFTPETKELLNQYFDKSNIKSAAAFDKFFEETFDVKHEHKDPSIVLPSAAKKEPEINKPSPSRHISREHDVGFTR